MAKSALMNVNGHPFNSNTKEFMLLSEGDVAKLPKCGIRGTLDVDDQEENDPVAYGSCALVKQNGDILTYLLFPDNEWTKI